MFTSVGEIAEAMKKGEIESQEDALKVFDEFVEGEVKKSDRVVVISTANGLKFADFKIRYHESRIEGVTSADGNKPVALKQADRQVAFTELVVRRKRHAIKPAIDRPGPGPLVLNGPGNVERDEVPNVQAVRCRQLRRRQVRIGRQLDERLQLCDVVQLVRRFDNRIIRVGLNEEVIRTIDPVRQRDRFLARV